MRIYKVILIPIISLALKDCGMRVLLGRNRSLLGAVSIADNARQGHQRRPGVKRRGRGRAVKEVQPCLGLWLHLQGRAVKEVQACLSLWLHLQIWPACSTCLHPSSLSLPSAPATPVRLRAVRDWKNASVRRLLRVLDPLQWSLVGAVEGPS